MSESTKPEMVDLTKPRSTDELRKMFDRHPLRVEQIIMHPQDLKDLEEWIEQEHALIAQVEERRSEEP